jgi:formiminotetrahydrofolate cyclodeaminase
MSDSIWDWTLRETRDAAASDSPTPGGGSIAAISGALGMSLVLMSLEITRAKASHDELDAVTNEGRALLSALSAHADRDVLVFDRYRAALALPKTTDVERERRTTTLQKAILAATQVPLTAAEDCFRGLAYAENAARLVQKNVISDLLGGSDILHGALRSVLRNVTINLPSLRDEAQRQELASHASDVAKQAEACYARILAASAV